VKIGRVVFADTLADRQSDERKQTRPLIANLQHDAEAGGRSENAKYYKTLVSSLLYL